MSREIALRILESGTSSEFELKRAELYLYMDRTKALTPEPVIQQQKVDTVWLMLDRTGGGTWSVRSVYTDEQAAYLEYESLSRQAAGTSGYWEVECKKYQVSS